MTQARCLAVLALAVAGCSAGSGSTAGPTPEVTTPVSALSMRTSSAKVVLGRGIVSGVAGTVVMTAFQKFVEMPLNPAR